MATGDLIVVAGDPIYRLYRMIQISGNVRDQISDDIYRTSVTWASGYTVGDPPSSENLVVARDVSVYDDVQVRYGFSQTVELSFTEYLPDNFGLAWDGTNLVEIGNDGFSDIVAIRVCMDGPVYHIFNIRQTNEFAAAADLDANGNLVVGFNGILSTIQERVRRYNGVSNVITDTLNLGYRASTGQLRGVAMMRAGGDLITLFYTNSGYTIRRYSGFSTNLVETYVLPFQWYANGRQPPPAIVRAYRVGTGGILRKQGTSTPRPSGVRISGGLTKSGAPTRRLQRNLSWLTIRAMPFAGNLSPLLVYPQAVSGEVATSGDCKRQTRHNLTWMWIRALASTGTLTVKLDLSRLNTGSFLPTGDLDRIPQIIGPTIFARSLEGAMSLFAPLSRTTTAAEDGALALMGEAPLNRITLTMETQTTLSGLVMETQATLSGLVMEIDEDLTLTMRVP